MTKHGKVNETVRTKVVCLPGEKPHRVLGNRSTFFLTITNKGPEKKITGITVALFYSVSEFFKKVSYNGTHAK